MIGVKTALALYSVLAVVALLTLHGTPLALAIVIVLGLAAKTLVDYFKRRMDSNG